VATTFTVLTTRTRERLVETTASFWTDAEILAFLIDGAKDLWRAILDLNQEHFLTNDVTNVSLAADATSLTGVPTDVFRVAIIEPRDTTSDGSAPDLQFLPRDFNHPDFAAARSVAAQSPNGIQVFYCLINAGAPVAAPSILTAPKLNAAVTLRLVYNQTLGTLTGSSDNPIPGEADNALINYAMAYLMGKQTEGNLTPDPEWLSLYATEKKNILIALTPRQTQEPETVEGYMEEYW